MCIEMTVYTINTERLRLNEINCRKLMFIGLGSTVNSPVFKIIRFDLAHLRFFKRKNSEIGRQPWAEISGNGNHEAGKAPVNVPGNQILKKIGNGRKLESQFHEIRESGVNLVSRKLGIGRLFKI